LETTKNITSSFIILPGADLEGIGQFS